MIAPRRLAVALLLSGLATVSRGRGDPPYHVERLGDGVWAVVRHDPVAFGNNANSLVVETDSGVLVVDAQFTRAATLQTLHAIRGLTPKPVRWVVNTHWHDDHVAGNQVYRDSFPGVDFVSQVNTKADLVALGAPNRKGSWGGIPGYVGRLERLMALGLGGDSTPLVPAEKAALESSIAILRQYAAEESGFRETLATVTFDRHLTLGSGRRRVELRWFGPANTRGDAVVVVPAQGIVATGDLLVSPGPFAFGSDVGGWVAALDSVRALRPRVMLPGHGPVMRDDAYLRLEQRMLAAVRDRTAAAVAAGATSLADVRKAVTLDDLRAEVAGDDKWKRTVFYSFFLGPAVGQAYEAARPKP
jgi:glyoxylase-like metal-dependent hydrolase (beta-lactamase superfamily II)